MYYNVFSFSKIILYMITILNAKTLCLILGPIEIYFLKKNYSAHEYKKTSQQIRVLYKKLYIPLHSGTNFHFST